MTSTVYIHGFPCKNCTDIDLAAKDIDPQHPHAGPEWLQQKKGPDGQPVKIGPDGLPETNGRKVNASGQTVNALGQPVNAAGQPISGNGSSGQGGSAGYAQPPLGVNLPNSSGSVGLIYNIAV